VSELNLLINERSLHRQFNTLSDFAMSIDIIMKMRGLAHQYGKDFYCYRGLARAQVTSQHSMQQAVQSLELNGRRAVMSWLNNQGPFWDDERVHNADDYFCQGDDGEIVTDSAIGEAAFCQNQLGLDRHLVSFSPSDWEFNPLVVNWIRSDEPPERIEIPNYWEIVSFENAVRSAPEPITSWNQLEVACRGRCHRLFFSTTCFEGLVGIPFQMATCERIRMQLEILDSFKGCFDGNGHRTTEGHTLQKLRFTGDKGWFSDSSDSEKREFKKELTFSHPEVPDKTLFCPWHGKVKTHQMPIRIHFSWPVRAEESLYVVHIGDKLTKR
jgi:hypothetical protein